MLISAASFAEPTSSQTNDQTNDAAETRAESRHEVAGTEAVTGIAIAQANSVTGEVVEWTALGSTQSVSGDITAQSEIEAQSVYGVATSNATAQGNALTAAASTNIDADVQQVAGSGTVSALSALRLGDYAGHVVSNSQATANAAEIATADSEANLALTQSSNSDVRAEARLEADNAEIETTVQTATAAGNSVTAGGTNSSTIMDIDQSNGGNISATAEADIANADYGATVASQAAGNTANLYNEWGYAHMQGEQMNSGDVEAMTRMGVGAFENGPLVGSANAVGNQVLLSNFGANAYAGVGQTNSGNVSANVVMQGGSGQSAFATSSAMGNAQSGYICSECPVGLDANTRQLNSGNVFSGVSQSYDGYVGAVTGSATAVGNASTFATVSPNGG